MRLYLWQFSAAILAVVAFGVGVGLLAIIALLIADIVAQCVE
jgi:hypothetical protein